MFRRHRDPSVSDDRPAAPSAAGSASERTEQAPVNVLQAGSVVTGRLEARGRLRVCGTVRGDVVVDGLLEVGAEGVIEASSVRASGLVVLGRVVADVDVEGSVEVWKGAVLRGDVCASSIDIESGASFVGRSRMRGDADDAVEALPAPAAGAPAQAAGAPAATAGVAEDALQADDRRDGDDARAPDA